MAKEYAEVHKLLIEATSKGASDLHLKVGLKPMMRIEGELQEISNTSIINKEAIGQMYKSILPESKQIIFSENGNVDSSYNITSPVRDSKTPEELRFRVNVGLDEKGPYIAIRLVPRKIRSVENVGFPFDVWKDIIGLKRGLVLVTGPTNSGKTTTLASLIQEINKTRSGHIITIEDPIEYVYPKGKCMFSQRELGIQVKSYSDGVKYSLRQDPDVLLIGEIRDTETAEKALEAAETGHLVFSTLHTSGVEDTVRRYVSMFSSSDRNRANDTIAANLAFILYQQLIPYEKDHGERTLAMEVLRIVSVPSVQNHLRKGEYHQLISDMQTSKARKMITLDDRLKELYEDGRLSRENAMHYARDKEGMAKVIKESQEE